jgi:UDP-N-acetyl-D-glucosamine dehydrogenase
MSKCVVGLGYVGLPLAVALAEKSIPVIGVDVSADRVAQLASGRSGIEDIPDSRLHGALASGLSVTSDIEDARDADTYVICVPTPLRDSFPDLTAVEEAGRAVATVLAPEDLVILESTTYPGTTEEVLIPLLEKGSGLTSGIDVHVAYSPERIDPGNPQWHLENTPKIVGGATEQAAKLAREFYSEVIQQIVPVKGLREAEMAKLLENTFRHVNIALVNEMAIFCHELGIDLWSVIDAAATKPFGFMPFYPGPGVGGHCIPVDPSYLSWRVRKLGYTFRFVELAQEINNQMPSYVVSRLADLLNRSGMALSSSRVLCLGVSYKPEVGDTRESPALDVVRLLDEKGCQVDYHDPFVESVELEGRTWRNVALTDHQLAETDAAIVLTPHRVIDLDSVAARVPILLDTRAATDVDGDNVQRL